MLDSLSQNSVQKLYQHLDLKEYIDTAVDSSYEGLCMLRPSVEHCADRYYQELFTGNTILKFQEWDGENSIFTLVSSESRYASDTMFVPLPLVQKMDGENFRPWNIDSILRHKSTDNWEILVDYASNGNIITQDLQTNQVRLRALTEMNHGKLYTRYGNAPYPAKGTHAVMLTKEQAELAGFPAGVIVPLLAVNGDANGEVTCQILGTDQKFAYKELAFRSSSLVRDNLRRAGIQY